MTKINKRGAIKYTAIILLITANILVLTLLISPTKAIPQDFSIWINPLFMLINVGFKQTEKPNSFEPDMVSL